MLKHYALRCAASRYIGYVSCWIVQLNEGSLPRCLLGRRRKTHLHVDTSNTDLCLGYVWEADLAAFAYLVFIYQALVQPQTQITSWKL
jgi:hypothetical protein